MTFAFIASAQADNVGGTTATLTVPTGVTTSHLGILVIADQGASSGSGQTISGGGWTARDLNSAAANNTTASVYIWSRLGGVAAGNTITVNLAVASNATVTGAWYDTGGRDIASVSTAWNNGGVDVGTVTFNAPGHSGTADVLLVLGHRTSGTNTFGALSPAGPTIDFQGKSATFNDGALFAHDTAVSRSYTSTLASSVVGHNFTTMQFALTPGSVPVSFSGSGTLAVTGAPKPAQSVAFSGSGTLAVSGNTPAVTQAVAFSGAGTLGVTAAPKPVQAVAFGGTGTLLWLPGVSWAPSGSGTLTASGVPTFLPNFLGAASFSGEGRLTVVDAVARGYHFSGLRVYDPRPLEKVYPQLLNVWIPYSQTVWQAADGSWHAKHAPAADDVAGALRVFPGGYLTPLTDALIAQLTAAGFAAYITLERV